MMDCLCVVRVNINAIGQRNTNLNSCGFCGGTGVLPTETRRRVSYIMMTPSETFDKPSYLSLKIPRMPLPIREFVNIWDFGVVNENDIYEPLRASITINGRTFVESRTEPLDFLINEIPELASKVGITLSSSGYFTIYPNVPYPEILDVVIAPARGAFDQNRANNPSRVGYKTNIGEVVGDFSNDTFHFKLRQEPPYQYYVTINNKHDNFNWNNLYFAITIDGVVLNSDKSQQLTDINSPEMDKITIFLSSNGSFSITNNTPDNTPVDIVLSPSEEQKQYSNTYLEGAGIITPDGVFKFTLQPAV